MLLRNCCHLRMAIRQGKHWFFGELVGPEPRLFTCSACHQSYHLVAGDWVPVDAVQDIKEMQANHPLSTHYKDPHA